MQSVEGGIMIQRYDFDIVNGGYEESDTGEWVKWEDVEKLISEGRIISKESVKMLNEMYGLVKSKEVEP
jgi:hypothetical protein